ncbi:MAPEG family protein [Bradyrhizobium sp. USDA 3364]
MSVQMVLLPVFIQIGLTFALLFAMATARTKTLTSGETRMADIALREPNWPAGATKLGNCFANQFELPVLFYVLIAIALPLRRADLFIVLMSWVFVVTRFAHAGVFVTSNDVRPRSLAWFAGVLVLAAMWLYFALRLLLLI